MYQSSIDPTSLLQEVIQNCLAKMCFQEREAVEAMLWQLEADFNFELRERYFDLCHSPEGADL